MSTHFKKRKLASMVQHVESETVHQHRYPWPVIETAVRMYIQDEMTFRAIADKMANLGVDVSHKTVFEWVNKFEGEVRKQASHGKMKRIPRSFHVEESLVKCNGQPCYLYRATDEHQKSTLALCLRKSKNSTAAKTFLEKEFHNLRHAA